MRQNRLRAYLILALLVAALSGVTTEAVAQLGKKPPKTNSSVQVTLKQQLEKGLKCRRPVEFEYVEHVVKLVAEEKLPIDTVNIAFAWSRKRNSYRPFVYFEAALTELAKREGIDILDGTDLTKKKLL